MNEAMEQSRHCPSEETRLQYVCDPAGIAPAKAAHISACDACQSAIAGWQATITSLQSDHTDEPDAALTTRILDAIDSAPRPLIIHPLSRRGWLAAAALLVACLGLGIHLRQPNAGDQQTLETDSAPQLVWLDQAQSPDGSWHPEQFGGKSTYQEALTGLALMGYATASPTARARRVNHITAAANFLIAHQQPDGRFGSHSGSAAMYNHSMATIGLIHIAPTTDTRGRPRRDRAIQLAANYLVAEQLPSGGWGYGGAEEPSANAGVTSWAILSLIAAQDAGASVPHKCIAMGLRWINAQLHPAGTFSYQTAQTTDHDSSATLTAIGALCLMRGNVPLADAQRTRLRVALARAVPDMEHDLYGSFLLKAALETAQPPDVGGLVVKLQQQVAASAASYNTDRWHAAGGDVYAHSLACITLSPSGQ